MGLQAHYGMDKLIAELVDAEGISVTSRGKIYPGVVEEGQTMEKFAGREPLAQVPEDHLRAYMKARQSDAFWRDVHNNPSSPGHFMFTDSAKKERRMAQLEFHKGLLAAQKEFNEWYTPGKRDLYTQALIGSIARDEIPAIQDILTYQEWFGKDQQQFHLKNISQSILTDTHHVKVADSVPNEMWSEDIGRGEVPRGSQVDPRSYQLDVLRQACLMSVNYQDQIETKFNIMDRMKEDAMTDYDRLIETKHAKALELINIETTAISSLGALSGTTGFHSASKPVSEIRQAITEFEHSHRVKLTHCIAHPNLWEAYRLNTWTRIDDGNPHPKGLQTSGGVVPMVGIDGIQSVSSTFVRTDRFYLVARNFGIIHGHGGIVSNHWMDPSRLNSQMAINAFVKVDCTNTQVAWYDGQTAGEKGRGYGMIIPAAV